MTHETIFICGIQQYNGAENTALAEHCPDEMLRYAVFHLGSHCQSTHLEVTSIKGLSQTIA